MFKEQKYNKKVNQKSIIVMLAMTYDLHIFPLMKINFTKIFAIIIISSAIGLIYNYINPTGLKFTSKEKELNWASDSILTSRTKLNDTIKTKQRAYPDSLNNSHSNKKVVKRNEISKEKTIAADKNKSEDSGFSEPLVINLEQAYKLYQMDFLFIDARDRIDYEAGHIKKSLSLPYLEYDKYKIILSKIPKSTTIITYCGGADCELSKGLANQLYFHGYHNIYVFFGGWGQWKSAGYPTE